MTTPPETSDVPEVLFVCVHNAGRSQMAAALLEQHAGGRVRVRSAGTEPSDEIDPNVVAAMAERGLDVAAARPRSLRDDDLRDADVVITMGCGDACPVVPGTQYLDWDLPNPAGRPLAEIRPIRDDIERRVLDLLGELAPGD
jgi:arsenate reductase (thioredoxin)